MDKYLDSYGKIRRIEKLYNKGIKLNEINNKILEKLNEIFEEPYTIFKDKFNAKPPGGEGFFAHYDGVFTFKDKKNQKRIGWYEYGIYFVNVLVALDPCNKENGTIEISNIHKGSFDDLILKTKNNGTPELLDKIEKKLTFHSIKMNIGDLVFFSNQCPHRSAKNLSKKSRRTLYYTYTPKKFGSFYQEYFNDKKNSKNNKDKSLSNKE